MTNKSLTVFKVKAFVNSIDFLFISVHVGFYCDYRGHHGLVPVIYMGDPGYTPVNTRSDSTYTLIF